MPASLLGHQVKCMALCIAAENAAECTALRGRQSQIREESWLSFIETENAKKTLVLELNARLSPFTSLLFLTILDI